MLYSCYDSGLACIEGSTLHKLLGILPLLAIEQRRRKKNRTCPWASFIFTKIFQANLKDMSEGHYVVEGNWMVMMTTLACLTLLVSLAGVFDFNIDLIRFVDTFGLCSLFP